MNLDQDLSSFSLFDLFRLEAEGQSRVLTDGLLGLERGIAPGAIEPLMRAAHSLKGAAAIVALDPAVQLAHAMEDALLALEHAASAPPERIDTLLAGVDLMLRLAQVAEPDLPGWLDANGEAFGTVTRDLATGLPNIPAPAESAPAPRATVAPRAAAEAASDELLALASQARLQAHQFEPFIASLQRYKRNQAAYLQVLEQLREAAAASGNARMLELSAQALDRAEPLKGALLRHIADAEDYERRARTVSSRLVDEVLSLRMCPFADGVQRRAITGEREGVDAVIEASARIEGGA